MTDVLQSPQVRKAERRLVAAIADLNLSTIKYLANDLGKSEVRAHTWSDCPMTLAQRVGNSLAGKTDYQSRKNVGNFATAWDSYMTVIREVNKASTNPDEKYGTIGFGVEVIQGIATEELAQRDSSIYQRAKKVVREATTTECVRETIGQGESEAIYNAIVGGGPEVPNTAIDV